MATVKFSREATVEQDLVAHIPDDVLTDITGFSLEELIETKYATDHIITLLGEQDYDVEFEVVNESVITLGPTWDLEIVK